LKFFTLGLILQFPEESWQIFKKKLHNREEKKNGDCSESDKANQIDQIVFTSFIHFFFGVCDG